MQQWVWALDVGNHIVVWWVTCGLAGAGAALNLNLFGLCKSRNLIGSNVVLKYLLIVLHIVAAPPFGQLLGLMRSLVSDPLAAWSQQQLLFFCGGGSRTNFLLIVVQIYITSCIYV